jgi:hypothetical protein
VKARKEVAAGHRDRIAAYKREHEARLVQVILATFEAEGHLYELAWVRRDGAQFRVTDRSTDSFVWCGSYADAHDVFVRCCEESGELTFRSHALQGGAS